MEREEVKKKLAVLLRKLMKDKPACRHLECYLLRAIPATKGKLTALMVEANDEQLDKFVAMLELSLQEGNLSNFTIDYTLKDTTNLDTHPKPEQPTTEEKQEASMGKVMADAIWPHLEVRITELIKKLCPGGTSTPDAVKAQLISLLNSAGGKG